MIKKLLTVRTDENCESVVVECPDRDTAISLVADSIKTQLIRDEESPTLGFLFEIIADVLASDLTGGWEEGFLEGLKDEVADKRNYYTQLHIASASTMGKEQ